ncbi:MAG: rod shape-determining protein MreC, partial [Bacilli bacterium]|nr:rod shape-determining protein MreC [Bacilli bacterium]
KYQEYSTIPAYVIDRDVSNYSSNIVINVGAKQGIEKNMTVIADKGLVGHVISVTDNTAKVQVIVDGASSVSSMISTSEESIICKGSVENDKNLNASYIDTSSELLVGDSVVTSGLGGIYPKGITIGTIKQVVNTSNITDRYAIVEAAVDFSKLYTVLVIK